MVVIYEFRERFRADVFKAFGFALCSPLCLVIGNTLIHGDVKYLVHWGTLAAFIFFIIGYKVLNYALLISAMLDELKYDYNGSN